MKKKYFFLSLTLIVSTLFFTWNYLGEMILEKYINSKCMDYFGHELKHRGYDLDHEKLIINNLSINIEEHKIDFFAEKITIFYQIHPFLKSINLDIMLDQPSLKLPENSILPSLIKKILNDKKFLNFNPNFKINGGVVQLKSEKDEKVFIDGEIDCKTFAYGKMSLNQENTSQSLQIQIEHTEKLDFLVDLSFDHIDLSCISKIINAIYPLSKDWLIKKGYVNGNLKVSRIHDKKTKAEGSVVLNGFEIENTHDEMFANIDSLMMTFTSQKSKNPNLLGNIILSGDNFINIFLNGKKHLKFDDIKGNFEIEKHGNILVQMHTCAGCDESEFPMSLNGNVRLFDSSHAFLSLLLRTHHPDGTSSSVDMNSKQFSPLWNSVDIEIKQLCSLDLQLCQKFFQLNYGMDSIPMLRSGFINAQAVINFKGLLPYSLDIKTIKGHNLVFDSSEWNAKGCVKDIQGYLTMDFKQKNFFESLSGEVNIDGAEMQMMSYEKEFWKLSDIQAKATFRKGMIQSSIIKGEFGDFIGALEVNWMPDSEAFKLCFNGNTQKLCSHLNPYISQCGPNKLDFDNVGFTAKATSVKSGFKVDADLKILSDDLSVEETIFLGFNIEKCIKQKNYDSYEKTSQTINLIQPVLKPSQETEKSFKKNNHFFGYHLHNGWFQADNISLKKYIAPILFQEDNSSSDIWEMEGIGNFYGTFDKEKVTVNYSAKNVVIENESFRIEIPEITQSLANVKKIDQQAYHCINFHTFEYLGAAFVEHGTYYDKHHSLLFNEVSTQLKFTNNKIYASNIETFCSGLFFSGDINIEMNSLDRNSYKMEIFADTMSGKVSQLQTLFSKFDKPPIFINFPMEGEVHFCKNGSYISFDVSPEKTQILTKLNAVLLDGSIQFAPLDIALKELEFTINYDQSENTLLMDKIQGTLLVGQPGAVEEYDFSGDKIYFSDFFNNISQFDLWVGDKSRDLIRFAGTTSGHRDSKKEGEWIKFNLDKSLSHFGDVFPANFSLRIKDWQMIEDFELDLKIHLATLFNDLKRVSRSGISLLPEDFFKNLDSIDSANGDFKILLTYKRDEKSLKYDFIGSNLELGPYSYKNILLNGYIKENKICSINQLRLDDLSVAAEVVHRENNLKVNFLGLKYGDSFLLGLDGDYFYKINKFEGKVNLIETSLDHLSEFKQLSEFIEKNQPKGNLKGNGKIFIEKSASEWNYNAVFNLSGTNIAYRDICLGDVNSFSCQIQKNKGVTFRNIVAGMLSPESKDEGVRLNFEKVYYNLQKDELEIEDLKFHVPANCLQWFSAKMRYAFYEHISQEVENQICRIKTRGNLETLLNMHMSSNRYLMALRLPEGTYHYYGEEFYLKDFLLTVEPAHMTISTGYRYQQKNLWLTVDSRDSEFLKGTLLVTNKRPEAKEIMNSRLQDLMQLNRSNHSLLSKASDLQSILIHWENDVDYGLYLKKINGQLGGLSVNLSIDQEIPIGKDYCYLEGDLTASLPEALQFTDLEFMNKCIENEAVGSLIGKGKFAISKVKNLPTKFEGNLSGNHVGLKGYYFDLISAQMKYTTHSVDLSSFYLNDPAGLISIESISLSHLSDYWHMKIPTVHIWNFRPWRLKETHPTAVMKANSLIFNHIYIEGLSGKLGNPETWIGEGRFKFSNPPKTNLQHTILAFPHELITKIGLNPSVLTPVIGSVYYHIANEKIIFKRFKDVYSESKGSKFYLPRSPFPSFIKFNGEMLIQIRMKQYNLLLKPFELMTVKVKGTLERPIYSIRKEKMHNSSRSTRSLNDNKS